MNVYIYNAFFGTDLFRNITIGKIQSFVTDFLSTICPSVGRAACLRSWSRLRIFISVLWSVHTYDLPNYCDFADDCANCFLHFNRIH